MKYMLMFCKSEEDDRRFDEMTAEERGQLFQQVADWQAQYKSSFVDQGYRLERPRAATTVRHQNGSVIVTDGPFVESGEVVGGYSIVDVPDPDVAPRFRTSSVRKLANLPPRWCASLPTSAAGVRSVAGRQAQSRHRASLCARARSRADGS